MTVIVGIEVFDSFDNSATIPYRVGANTDVAALLTAMGAIASNINTISGVGFTGLATLRYVDQTLGGLTPTAPTAGYSIYNGATFSMEDANGEGRSLFIPGVLDSLIVGNTVNEADAGVAAVVADLLANYQSLGGADMTAFKKATESTRKVR